MESKIETIKRISGRLETISRLLVKPELKEIAKILSDTENVEDMVQGTYKNKQGLLVATNVRLIFIHKGLLYGMSLQDFSYNKITTIEYKTGLVDARLTIYAAGNIEEIKNIMPRSRARDFGESVRSNLSNYNPISVTSRPATDITIVEQLEKLGLLKEKGLITDNEFDAEKRRILK